MKTDRGLLLLLIGLLVALSVYIVRPYITFVLAAVLLGFVLQPLQGRLADRIGETVAAVALVVGSVIAFVLPFIALAAYVIGDVMRMLESFERDQLAISELERIVAETTGFQIDVAGAVQSTLEEIGTFGGVLTAFGTLTHAIIGLGLFLFLLFFFVRDGDDFVTWLRDVAPMPVVIVDDLLEGFASITRAVLVGHVLVAIVQGVIAGVGLLVTGIPNAIFWTIVMVILALIPLIGTFPVWAPASAYLVWTGSPIAGVALFVYGIVVVGVSDEYLRPVVVDRYASVSPGVIIVGVIGGLSVFGFIGLFVGPVVVGAAKVAIEVYDDHYGDHEEFAGP